MWNEGKRTFTAGEALEANRRVKIKSGTTTTPPQVEYADGGEDFVGVTEYAVASGDRVAVKLQNAQGTFAVACKVASAIVRGTVLYGYADGKLCETSNGSAQAISLQPAADGAIIEVLLIGGKSTTAATTTLLDANNYTLQTTVEAAVDELYENALTDKGLIPIPMPNITDAGAALAAFSNGDSTVPGYCVTAKGLGIRWNNHATPAAVGTKIVMPPDADVTANMVLHILAAKTGATVGDATKFTVAAYNNDVGAAYDADSDFGGDTSAMTGDATAKSVQEVTLTLALANLTAYPAAVELTIKPKAGTLGTDDVIMLGHWIEYKKKLVGIA